MTITTCSYPAQRGTDGLAVIGRTKHALMGIRYLENEGGDDAAAQAAAAAAATAAAGGDNAPWTKENFDPERAQKLLENVRGDLATTKAKHEKDIADAVEKATKSTLAQFAKLIGGGEQTETDPVKLAAKVTELTNKVSEQDGSLTAAQSAVIAGKLSTEVAVQAHGLGASAKKLLANKDFMTSIASVDPTDEAAITAKITAALQANAALGITPASSGSDGHQGATLQSLETQLAKAEKDGDVSASIVLKRRIRAAKAN
ncbi:hypothetical protein [Glaciihabitans sp. dw_435]|uniref:hypothetical protein n=1 Tax=Glaciihabitans sp. dw_435 TaxID=2720081 RepID=UPI001BD1BF30|nr:hypothetical protein [Glaciihabitans sp. dw_435]